MHFSFFVRGQEDAYVEVYVLVCGLCAVHYISGRLRLRLLLCLGVLFLACCRYFGGFGLEDGLEVRDWRNTLIFNKFIYNNKLFVFVDLVACKTSRGFK